MTVAEMLAQVEPMCGRTAIDLGHPHGSRLFDDLMSAARLRLVKVAARFDPDRGVKWSTFAQVVIRRAMLSEIKYTRRPRPAAMSEVRRDDDAAEAEAVAPAAREFSQVDVAGLLADPTLPRLYRRALKAGSVTAVKRSGLPKREAERILQWAQHTLRKRVGDR